MQKILTKEMTLKRFFLGTLAFISFVISGFLAATFAILFYFGRGLPDQGQLKDYEPTLTNRFCLENGEVWRDYAMEKRLFSPIDLMPDILIQAFLVAEDRHFYVHPGLDLLGVFRAAVKNTVEGKWKSRPMGASTITQQVVKNFFAGTERSLERKAKEAIMALRLENALSKKRILELYLNQIYLGAGTYGVVAAAETYFQKKLEDLSIDEVAYLATLPKAPSTYQSKKNPAQTKARRDWILDGLYEAGHITGHELLMAKERPISIPFKPKTDNFEGDYFIEAVRLDLMKRVGKEAYDQGGYTLATTVQPDIQSMASRALCHGLELYDKRMGYRGPLEHIDIINPSISKMQFFARDTAPPLPGHTLALVMEDHPDHLLVAANPTEMVTLNKSDLSWCGEKIPVRGDVILLKKNQESKTFELSQIPEVTGGIVVMNIHTGRVLALSGGYHFKLNQYNAAIQALRQPGSTFKAFIYLAALERGYKPETKVLDAPLHIPLGFKMANGQSTYSPKNFSNRFYGMQTLAFGLSRSINTMTVRLAMQIGIKPIEKIAVNFGIYDSLPRQWAMMLGAGETTLLKMTAAFAMIGNGGKKINPTLVDSIEDRYGHTLYSHNSGLHREVNLGTTIDMRESIARPESIEAMKDMLTLAVQEGTGRKLKPLSEAYGVTISAKTGTSNDCKDAWFVGFSGDIAVGVFIGYPTPRSMGDTETGGKVAAPVGYHFFENYFKRYPPQKPEKLEEISTLSVPPAPTQDEVEEA